MNDIENIQFVYGAPHYNICNTYINIHKVYDLYVLHSYMYYTINIK